jgi:hypothetical protein
MKIFNELSLKESSWFLFELISPKTNSVRYFLF